MRSSALLSLLPILATLPLATVAHSHHKHSHGISQRKSLSFGPSLGHATYSTELVDAAAIASLAGGEIDVRQVAIDYIKTQVGDDFFVRDDSYTDARTGVTHIYAKQLVNGLEVADGDLNLNIAEDGTILSFGSSFHAGEIPSFGAAKTSDGHVTDACSKLDTLMRVHKKQLAKLKEYKHTLKHSSEQLDEETKAKLHEATMESKAIHQHMTHLRHHLDSLCEPAVQSLMEEQGLKAPTTALLSLLPRLHAGEEALAPLPSDGLSSHHVPSFTPSPAPAEPPTSIITGPTLAEAGVVSQVPARLVYSQTNNAADPIRLTWKFEVEMQHNWYEAYVDAETLEVVRIVDWASDSPLAPPKEKRGLAEFIPSIVSEAEQVIFGKGGKQKPFPKPPKKPSDIKAEYGVFPWGINDPECGNVTVVTQPWDTVASPAGWHSFPKSANPWTQQGLDGMMEDGSWSNFTTTIGNNVAAHEDWEGQNNWLHNYRPKNESLSFVYPYLEPDGLRPKEYIDMVVTQLFYTCNMYHDLLYRLGFDELSGNFQMYNFGKGGRGGDAVIANAQDGSGYNNANFMTPPDGQMGRMRMYIWDTATPYRDGDLEAGIVIHEYSHGLSTRLVGGPANSGCLGYGEAGGMGEGWGDAMATFIRQIEEHHKHKGDVFSMGAYAANREQGIRNYKYATNSTINPSTYKTLDKPGYWGVHAIGEVHAEILFVIEEVLVKKHGFSKTLFPPLDPTEPNDYYRNATAVAGGKPKRLVPKHGNTLTVQLIVDALKLLPCRPTFLNHRDAFLQAEMILTGGENQCEIWQAFADRGLGPNAKLLFQSPWGAGQRSEDYSIPKGVCKKGLAMW